VSVGEVAYLGNEWMDENRTCACGVPYERCSFWEGVIGSSQEAKQLSRLQRKIEHRRSLPQLLTRALPEESKRVYRDRMRDIFVHIAQRGNAEIVVDSSKSPRLTAGRFWALKKVAGMDVQVLHLVRDGRDVLNSFATTGSNWALEGYREERARQVERALVGWVLANSIASVLGRALGQDRYLQIRFEDLRTSPQHVLREVGAFAGLDMEAIAKDIIQNKSFVVGHNVGGNRIRQQEAIRLRRKSNSNSHPRAGLSAYHRSLFAIFGQWLNCVLGY